MLSKAKKMNILITGGTGMIGHRLTELLLEKGHRVSYLSRKKEKLPNVEVFQWNIKKGFIETGALENADYVIHLAGAGIADKRWTEKRKQEIIDSRIEPIELINKYLQEKSIRLKGFISASAIGFYGGDTGDKKLDESSQAGNDFLAKCTKLWEISAQQISAAERVVSIRIGIVLSEKGVALPKLVLPIRFGFGAALGSGQQFMSWIHIDDLCRIFIQAIENHTMHGAFNAVSPNPVTNQVMTNEAAKVLKRPLWLPNVPSFILKLVFGEMGIVVTGGNFVLNKRISQETNFQYQFTNIKEALTDLLEK
ncbi:Epimerase family protein [Emticicia aquatica]|uniref:Epimerase family protein n=2 Tax=Emticicia aquatica TaxID=1681835 RepID=A0ABM9AT32_9BACT|nr:Epimerase family protein [Emticicia aquatica]